MDWLSRIGLLAVELLEAQFDQAEPALRERTGVCLESCTGCLTTDVRFLETPRPSLFTYTLPSTLLGEICIRHRLKGPQLCLLTADGSGTCALAEAIDWIETGAAVAAVCVCAEALSADAATALPPAPEDVPWPTWRADALLLSRTEHGGEFVTAHGSVAALCRKLCIDKPIL
jgi:3-oxoacyl-(acyl-carrier-protein) synthase